VAVIVGMGVFGAGFGIVQNATFALMIEGAAESGTGAASALWNLAYDVGYGAGPAAFGLIVSHTGYPAAFVMTGVLMLTAIPAARSSASVWPAVSLPRPRGHECPVDLQRPVRGGVAVAVGDELCAGRDGQVVVAD